MLKLYTFISCGCAIWCLLAGCTTSRDLVVLLPDPDGKVGEVQVTTRAGFQVLDKAGYATRVKDADDPPVAPERMKENKITDVFAAALAAQPSLPYRFVSFDLFFATGTTKLINRSKESLPEIVTTIKGRGPKQIFVIGHADRVGTDSHNMKLSARRAHWVRDFLISRGIDSGALVVAFYGETAPRIDTEDGVAEQLNRRVEVIVK